MPQISLYIDEASLKKIESAAERQHMSISKWVANLIRSHIEPIYPPQFEDLFGSIQDETFAVPEDTPFTADAKREEV
jgi:hypothetical protein